MDQKRFEQVVPDNDQRRPDDQFADALQLSLPNVRTLSRMILGDLDTRTYGISWWNGFVKSKRRILIGDQLALVARSIEINITEAKLHLLEALGHLDDCGRNPLLEVFGDANRNAYSRFRRYESAADQLPSEFAKLHIVGFFRAIGSALDCFGSTIIGVLALPANLLRGDLIAAQRKLEKVVAGSSDGALVRAEFLEKLNTNVERAGPRNWLPWTLAYRNMLVHRGRHFQPWLLKETGTAIGVNGSQRKVGMEAFLLLSREPGRSEVDALRDHDLVHVLTEEAQVTLGGVLGSVTYLLENSCSALSEVWERRRARPDLLVQPDEQWADPDLPQSIQFDGYSPRHLEYNPSQLHTEPAFAKRIQAAALNDDRRTRWESFE